MTRSSFDAQGKECVRAESLNSKSYKGRIPLRLPNIQKKPLHKPKSANNDEFQKAPVQVATLHMNNRPLNKKLRPSSNDKPSTIPKKAPIKVPCGSHFKGVITVPIDKRTNDERPLKFLPKQETIEIYEAQLDKGVSDSYFADEALLTSCSDHVMQIKISWQHYLQQYEKMKSELSDRQKDILELLSIMRSYREEFVLKREDIDLDLPNTNDLSFMDVGLIPELLFDLSPTRSPDCRSTGCETFEDMTFDVQKFFTMPTKLVTICEKTLSKRKEVIDWFESLLNDASNTSKEKGIVKNILRKKIYNYNTENQVLQSDLEKNKNDFYNELNNFLNKGVKETLRVAVNEHTRAMKFELEKLRSRNEDLQKQLRDRPRNYSPSGHMKQRAEELERELKEEKSKVTVLKDRLQRTERKNRATEQLLIESGNTVECLQKEKWALERTNEDIQKNFDKELTNLTECIKKNTTHLEEIANARETLQQEKEDLEEKLKNVTDSYNESLKQMKIDNKEKLQMITDLEEKSNKDLEDKQNLKAEIDALVTQLNDYKKNIQDKNLQLKEKDLQLNKLVDLEKDNENLCLKLEDAKNDMESYQETIAKQNDVIKEMEEITRKCSLLEKTLRNDIRTKSEYIAELEHKLSILEEESQENESKMNLYEEQLTELKSIILQLQNNLGKFDNITDLNKTITELHQKLSESTSQKEQLKDIIKCKELELQQNIKKLQEQVNLAEERESLLKMMSDKDEEQANIIKLLKNNLQMRNEAEANLNRQLTEMKSEKEKYSQNLDTRKQQILEMEKIIITLEDQAIKANSQIKKDHEKIGLLLKKIANYESYQIEIKRTIDAPSEQLDSILKILEDEMANSFNQSSQNLKNTQNYNSIAVNDKKCNFEKDIVGKNLSILTSEPETRPTKIVLGNYIKKTYIQNNEDQLNDTVPIENIDPKVRRLKAPIPEQEYSTDGLPSLGNKKYTIIKDEHHTNCKDESLLRNFHLRLPNQLREERKNKMFKLAGHRL